MKRVIKNISILFFLIIQISSALLLPVRTAAAEAFISSPAQYPADKVDDIASDIVEGNKLPLKATFFASGDSIVEEKFTVFLRKSSSKNTRGILKAADKYTLGDEFGESIAIPVTIENKEKRESILNELDVNPEVIAITQVGRRFVSVVNAPNDPKYPPAGNFTDTYQWNLNQPALGNYGIDLLRAWQYMDSQGVNWRGSNTLTVAVMDTGLAYESISKYPYSGGNWGFAGAQDRPLNLYTNAGEVGDNLVDDDANGAIEDSFDSPLGVNYCLDLNSNGQCESPAERTKGYVDDLNGLNVIDFANYWDPYDIEGSPNCSNAPYTSYKCVPQRVCDVATDSGSNSWGCVGSEMGHANDLMGHGTAVAGLIAGAVGNSIAGTGISPNVKILPLSVFSYEYNSITGQWDGSASSDNIARAVSYAADAGAKIINMSFGGSTPDAYEQLAMERAYEENGVLLVAAAGNGYDDTIEYPAAYSSVIAVGATNKNGIKAGYSNSGSDLELTAPVGGGLPLESYTCYFAVSNYENPCLTTNPRPNSPSQFTQFTVGLTAGTSFASPQVAAVAALIWTLHPTWSNEQVRYVLKMSAVQPSGGDFNTLLGYGILNAYNAVRSLNSRGRDLTQKGRVVQSIRGTDNLIRTRLSEDHGQTWASWISSTSSLAEPTLIFSSTFNRLLQFRVGRDSGAYFRMSNDFGNTWGIWVKLGVTEVPISVVDTGDRIIMAIRSTNDGIYTRYSTDGGLHWSGLLFGGTIAGTIETVYDSNTNKVVQATRAPSGRFYSRNSSDKGSTWSSWVGNGTTLGNISMIVAGSQTIQAMRGTSNNLYQRSSTDGGTTWSNWVRNGLTLGDIELVYTGSRLIEAYPTSGYAIATRYSTNLGGVWSAERRSGSTKSPIKMIFDLPYNRIFMSHLGLNGLIYTRQSDDGGKVWSNWVSGGASKSSADLLYIPTQNW